MTEDGYVTILGTGTTQIYAVAKASDNFVRQVSDAITVTVEEDPKPQPKPDDDQNQNGSGRSESAEHGIREKSSDPQSAAEKSNRSK